VAGESDHELSGSTERDRGTESRTGGVLGVGFRSLLKREILRFVRRPRNTLAPPAITNVLYFAVFGVILGSRIEDIAGEPYLLFILPGLVVLGAIGNAFENSSFSIFHGRWNEYIRSKNTQVLHNIPLSATASFRGRPVRWPRLRGLKATFRPTLAAICVYRKRGY
jgi:hypothetical protein